METRLIDDGQQDPDVGGGSPALKRNRVEVCVLVADMVDSTLRKMTTPEGAWLDSQLMFAEMVLAAKREWAPDAGLKSNGDGFLIFNPDVESTLPMIQLAIAIQEAIDVANARVDGAMGAADFAASIAITTGSALAVDLFGPTDYWGFVVDKAARLCATASPNAIFVDTATVAATNLNRIHSKVGSVLKWNADDYVGPRESIPVKGVAQPVEYHEICWDRQPYGVRSTYVTRMTEGVTPSTSPQLQGITGAKQPPPDRRVGKVKCFDASKKFGFITSSDGEEFFVAPNLLIYEDDVAELRPGTAVSFLVAPASQNGRNRRAASVLIDATEAEGTLRNSAPERPFGFLHVAGDNGNSVDVFVSKNDLPSGPLVGKTLGFRVQIGERGARAVDVEAIADDSAA